MADNCQKEEEKPVGLEMSRQSGGLPCTHMKKRYKQQGQYQDQPGMGEGGNRSSVGSHAWPQTNHKSRKNRRTSSPPHQEQAAMSKGYAHKPLVTKRMLENPWAGLEQRYRS